MRMIPTIRHRQMAPTKCAGLPLMVIFLALLFGCATAPVDTQDASTVQVPAAAQGPTVVRLEGEGAGFIIQEVPRMDADSHQAFDQAVTLIQQQAFSQAVELLEPITAQSPGVTAPHINLAMAYEAVGEKEKAEAQLLTALGLVPDHPVACHMYGLLCRQNGDFARAREYYEKAVTSFPEYYPVHRNLGILCDLYLNDPACALKHYELYSAAKPDDEQVKLWIADLRNRQAAN